MRLYTAGWKSVSLVDVVEHPTFTLWLCGCNLQCPFCHNWRIAERDSKLCRWIEVDTILEEVEASKFLVDYLHVTGGEPLIQYTSVKELFEKTRRIGLATSLNSNLTTPLHYLKHIVEPGLVDHVATDFKIPPGFLYGLPEKASMVLWRNFVESLKYLGSKGVELELRIPVYKELAPSILEKYLDEIISYLNPDKTTVVFNPLIGEPFTNPRDPAWCRKHCIVDDEQVKKLTSVFNEKGFNKIIVKSISGFTR